ncbi:MAG: hypothetical protein ACRENG_29635 [bacterium]
MPALENINEAAGLDTIHESNEINRTLALGFRLLAAVEAFAAQFFGNDLGSSLATPGGRNSAFETLMTGLTEALYKLDEHPTFHAEAGTYEATRLRQAASQLADNLISRSSGIASFAARDILEMIQQALEILKQTPVQQAVSASSVWGAVRSIAERYMNESFDISSHVTRGKAGMMVLAWLAEALPHLGDYNAPLVALDHPVIAAATEWLQASLALEERSMAPIETR